MRRPQEGDSGYTWVLSITWRGSAYHWTSRAIGLDGPKSTYVGLVSINAIPERLSLDGNPALPEVSVSISWPTSDPVAEGIASGASLVGTEARLSLVPSSSPGIGSWADRYVVVRGVIEQPLWGDASEPVSFAIVRYEDHDRSSWPPAEWKVSEYTFPTSSETVSPPGMPPIDIQSHYKAGYVYLSPDTGSAYPVPWGTPGVIRGRSGLDNNNEVPVVPAIVVDRDSDGLVNTLLVSGGRPESNAFTLWYLIDDVWYYHDFSGGSSEDKTLVYSQDAIGQPIAVYNMTTGWTDAGRSASKYATSWPNGGVLLSGRPEGSRGAGQLGVWWLERSGIPVDVPTALGASSELDAYRMDGWLEEPVSASEWIADRLTGALPAFMANAANGSRYLRPIQWQAVASDSRAKLIEGAGTVRRSDRVATIGDGRAKTIVVRWGFDLKVEGYAFTTYRYIGDVSRGIEEELEIELPDCYEARTAELVAQWTAWREAAPRDQIRITVATDRWGWLSPGDVVTYTESGLSMTDRVCLVSSIERTDQPWASMDLLPIR
jgi:hypothetical protein